jgi:folate-dependent phosphoribosylglycinamide formyltransferase PurN
VRFEDTPDTLAARVLVEEYEAYPEAVSLFARKRLRIVGNRVHVLTGGHDYDVFP